MCRADVLNIIFGVMSTFAVFASGKASGSRFFMGRIKDEINGIGIEGTIVMVALCLLFYKKGEIIRKGINRIPAVIAAIFSIFMLIGKSYSMMGNWNFIFADIKQFVIACFVFCGYFLLFYLLLSMLFKWVSEHDFLKEPQKISWIPDYARKHVFLVSFMVILIGWLPYLIAFSPGSISWDPVTQLAQFFALIHRSDHHTYIVTLFMGTIFSLGGVVNDNFGYMLLIIVLCTIEITCYAWICVRLKQWRVPDIFRILVLVFYTFVPIFVDYAQSAVKDGLYFALFSIYMVEYVDICRKKLYKNSGISFKQIALFSLCSILVCLWRNNGIYLVLPANICLIFAQKKNRKVLIVSLLVVLGIFANYKMLFLPMHNVSSGSIAEMLSIPFQQTARYLKYYPNDVTDEEKATINQVLDVKKIAKDYNPEISDPVKRTFKQKNYKLTHGKALMDYFKVWGKMFFRHPGVYVDSFFNGAYGYIYPFAQGRVKANNTQLGMNIDLRNIAFTYFKFNYYFSGNIRTVLKAYVLAWWSIPFIAQIVASATYTWILLLVSGLLFKYNKKWTLIVLVAPLFNVLVCVASPVNGYVRYAWPIAAGMPVIIAWLLLCLKDENLDKQRVENMY